MFATLISCTNGVHYCFSRNFQPMDLPHSWLGTDNKQKWSSAFSFPSFCTWSNWNVESSYITFVPFLIFKHSPLMNNKPTSPQFHHPLLPKAWNAPTPSTPNIPSGSRPEFCQWKNPIGSCHTCFWFRNASMPSCKCPHIQSWHQDNRSCHCPHWVLRIALQFLHGTKWWRMSNETSQQQRQRPNLEAVS